MEWRWGEKQKLGSTYHLLANNIGNPNETSWCALGMPTRVRIPYTYDLTSSLRSRLAIQVLEMQTTAIETTFHQNLIACEMAYDGKAIKAIYDEITIILHQWIRDFGIGVGVSTKLKIEGECRLQEMQRRQLLQNSASSVRRLAGVVWERQRGADWPEGLRPSKTYLDCLALEGEDIGADLF